MRLRSQNTLQDGGPPSIRLKLSAMWASLMFLYIYGDYFGLYVPGKLVAVGDGRIGPFGVATSGVMVGVSLMMAIPSLMVCFSVILPPVLSRWLSIIFGMVYSAILLLTMIGGAPPFYLVYGAIEISLTLTIAFNAWNWPKEVAGSRD
jgi:hypothetical protein